MTDRHIIYSFPSRSRPDKFEQACQNIWQMSQSSNYLIVAKIDEDDPAIDHYLLNAESNPAAIAVEVGHSANKVDAINRSLPPIGKDDILICMSDDMRFLVPGFDNIIRQHCGPDDFVHFPDGYANKKLCTMSIMGGQYYQRDGHIYHSSYRSLWCDNEAMMVAIKRKRYKYVRQQIFDHPHPAWTGEPKDALLLHNESFHNEDKQNYIQRKRKGFPK